MRLVSQPPMPTPTSLHYLVKTKYPCQTPFFPILWEVPRSEIPATRNRFAPISAPTRTSKWPKHAYEDKFLTGSWTVYCKHQHTAPSTTPHNKWELLEVEIQTLHILHSVSPHKRTQDNARKCNSVNCKLKLPPQIHRKQSGVFFKKKILTVLIFFEATVGETHTHTHFYSKKLNMPN